MDGVSLFALVVVGGLAVYLFAGLLAPEKFS